MKPYEKRTERVMISLRPRDLRYLKKHMKKNGHGSPSSWCHGIVVDYIERNGG